MSDTNVNPQELIMTSLTAANACLERQKFEEAIELCSNILQVDAKNDQAIFLWSLANLGLKQASLAEKNIKKAISLNDQRWEYHVHLANILHSQNRHSRAEKSFKKALNLSPENPEAQFGVAAVALATNKLPQAVHYLEQLLSSHPTHLRAQKTLGGLYCLSGQIPKGISLLEEYLKTAENDVEATGNLAAAYSIMNEQVKSAELYKKLLTLTPNDIDKRAKYVNTLHSLGHQEEAMEVVSEGLDLDPTNLQLLDHYGIIKLALNDIEGAKEEFLTILARDPSNASAHTHLGFAYLAEGNFENGWKEYEWRFKAPNYPAEERNFPRPLWDGSINKDSTLLLYTEQGAGDAVQFARFITQAKERVGHIILACQPQWVDLFENFEDVDTLISEGEIPNFDTHLALMSLPKVLGTTLENLPTATPYLKASQQKSKDWKEKLSSYKGLKVGFVTSGNPQQRINPLRSFEIEKIAPWLELKDATFFSLQKMPEGYPKPNYPSGVVDLADSLDTFSDTAAAIDNMDIIVSVCTSVAHIAGALGKPTLIMLSKSADWRWMTERQDTPWYPSAKLFRQTQQNVWDDVIENVKAEIAAHS